jgi:hypothetical protein
MKRATGLLLTLVVVSGVGSPALGQSKDSREECRRAVVFTLPGVTWSDVERWKPPNLLRAVGLGSAGSVSVRTISSRTSYASGFATLGAGSRLDGGFVSGGPAEQVPSASLFRTGTRVAGLSELRERAAEAGYNAHAGALGSALGAPLLAIGNDDPGLPVPTPARFGRWPLYAAMNRSGVVDAEATGPELLERDAGAPFGVRTDRRAIARAFDLARRNFPCASVVMDHGDLARADRWGVTVSAAVPGERRDALLAADDLLGRVLDGLEARRDLLLIVSPTSPWWARDVHLGVAVAVGPGYSPDHTLVSASTRRRGIVTLPDVAPTVLQHLGRPRPPSMNGRSFTDVTSPSPDRLHAAIALDRESIFVGRVQGPISSTFIVFQVLVYLATIALLSWRERGGSRASGGPLETGLELAALAIVAFFPSSYLVGALDGHTLGVVGFSLTLVSLDAALVAAASLAARGPLERLLVLAAATVLVILVDLVLGARLELNTVFGYSPIVAGRFAGIGNTGFAALGAAAALSGALLVHRWGAGRRPLAAVGALFVLVVFFDGAPQLGSDVGGVIALVPGFAITWVLLSGRRPSLRLVALTIVGSLLLLGAFLVLDLSRPPDAQTHLARLFEDVRSRGPDVLADTVRRKAEANLRVFRTTIWTYFVPPALGVLAWLLFRPRGRWHRLAVTYPRLRAGLVGGLVLALLGFGLNDSGIVIPAVILSFLVPMAMMVHLALERGEGVSPEASEARGIGAPLLERGSP